MLDNLARRVEVRTAEIRAEAEPGAIDGSTTADEHAVKGSVSSDPASSEIDDRTASAAEVLDRLDELAPPADQTPAWGRLAELSALLDSGASATSSPAPDVEHDDAPVGDGESDDEHPAAADDVSQGELFTPHGDLGILLVEEQDEVDVVDVDPAGRDLDQDGVVELVTVTSITDDAGDEPEAIIEVELSVDEPSAAIETADDGTETGAVLSAAAERLGGPSDDAAGATTTGGVDGLDLPAEYDVGPVAEPDLVAVASGDLDPTPTPGVDGVVDLEAPAVGAVVSESSDAIATPAPSLAASPSGATGHGDLVVDVHGHHAELGEAHWDDDYGPDYGEPEQVVRGGVTWYRRQISQFGVIAGLVPMVILAVSAWLALASRLGVVSGWLGLVLGTAAAPGLLVAGAPLASSDTYPYAAVASVAMWLVIGWVARRRTLQRPVADWRDYAIQLGWLTLAVVIGVCVALVIAGYQIGGSLLN